MNKGFTMVEFLVVVFIIGILSSVLFFNWRSGEERFALQNSAYKLAQNIREMQEMAMSAKICAEAIPPGVPPRYGIYMHAVGSSFYRLFADMDNNGMVNYLNPSPDILLSRINYEDGVYLHSIDLIGCSPTGPEKIHLTFKPPDPITEIKIGVLGHEVHDPVKCSEITLNLRVGISGPIKSVIVNQAGLVYVK
jgi:prepilin-type N-terminal cleavage/methylation domain-containing protein